MTTSLSRRAIVAGATAAAVPATALAVAVAAQPDPIFLAIDLHRRAEQKFSEVLKQLADLEDLIPFGERDCDPRGISPATLK